MRQLELPPEPDSVTAARRFLAELDLPEPPRQNAELLVSEVVTNAIRHAGLSEEDRIRVSAERGRELHVEVCHPGPSFAPRPRAQPTEEPGGWGLRLVEALADRWGVHGVGEETCVWFTLAV
jgi:anti-sigma regulatory factor (Ser/Thr protein kinase)